MRPTYTKDEFFKKTDYEGGLDGMADYAGVLQITDDKDLNDAWNNFVTARQDIIDIFDEWLMTQPEGWDND